MNVTKRNRLKFKNKNWLKWRRKRQAMRIALAGIMAMNTAVAGAAQIRIIQSARQCGKSFSRFNKALAIAKAVVDTNIATMEAYKKYAPSN